MKNFLFWKKKNFEEIKNLEYGDPNRIIPNEEFRIIYHKPIYIGFKEFIKKIF